MMIGKLTSWECRSCKEYFLDPISEIPFDKICVSCKTAGENVMKKKTSTGVEPATSIKDVLARQEIAAMSDAEKLEYLKMLGFPLNEINASLAAKVQTE